MKTLKQNDWQSKSSNIAVYNDSNYHAYAIQIWPKGTFTFSNEEGFSGAAEKVSIRGTIRTGATKAKMSTEGELNKSKEEVRISDVKKEAEDERKQIQNSSVSWKWVLAIGVAFTLISWVVYRKLT